MTTHLLRYDDPQVLARAARSHLLHDEAMNNVFFGVMDDAAHTDRYGGENLWLAALESGEVIGVAMRTPPYPVSVSFGAEQSTAAMLVGAALGAYDDDELDFMLAAGLAADVQPVLAYHGYSKLELLEGQGVYQISEVRQPDGVDGHLRLATAADLETIGDWTHAFGEESSPQRTVPTTEQQGRLAERLVEGGMMYVWEVNGEPVSMAAVRGPTPNGIRISYVYTPPEHRNNGYASSVVAGATQAMLDDGKEFCFLYTDLANPTSNQIYRGIGYEKRGEMNIYRTRRR